MFGGLLRVLGIAIGAGGVVGVALGLTVLADDPSGGGSVSAATATAYACPGVGEVGTLHGGDRVLITGRSGDWLAVRNVRGGLERVFVFAAAVTPDADLANLPEVSCDLSGSVALNTTTTTTAVPDDTTTTTAPIATTTTTTTIAATTTTTPAAPSVGTIGRTPTEIWEMYFDGSDYSCFQPNTSTISAAITAPAGIQSVNLSWSAGGGIFGQKAMTPGGGSTYTASLVGPFPEDSIVGGFITINITVTVTDNLARSASAHSTVTLHDCSFD
jgi:hypothetical protein